MGSEASGTRARPTTRLGRRSATGRTFGGSTLSSRKTAATLKTTPSCRQRVMNSRLFRWTRRREWSPAFIPRTQHRNVRKQARSSGPLYPLRICRLNSSLPSEDHPMRCKEHFQGDRCRKEARHDSEVAMTPDNVHVGMFSSWEGEGDSQKKIMQSQAPILKRDRKLERFMRNPLGFRVRDKKGILAQLENYKRYQQTNKEQSALISKPDNFSFINENIAVGQKIDSRELCQKLSAAGITHVLNLFAGNLERFWS